MNGLSVITSERVTGLYSALANRTYACSSFNYTKT